MGGSECEFLVLRMYCTYIVRSTRTDVHALCNRNCVRSTDYICIYHIPTAVGHSQPWCVYGVVLTPDDHYGDFPGSISNE